MTLYMVCKYCMLTVPKYLRLALHISYHMAMRALANLSHEGDKLVKCPRGHVITGLLQFELLCGTITE